MWLWSERIEFRPTQKFGSNPGYQNTLVFVLKSEVFKYLLGAQLSPSSYAFLSNQSHLPHPSENPLNKEQRHSTAG